MRSLGFLFSRRWLAFAVVVVLVALATWWLGNWQFDRLDDRRASNDVIRANETLPPAEVGDVLSEGVDDSEQWRQITATGVYDSDRTTIIRFRTSEEGESGVRVVVPLVTADGTLVAIDRGWMPAIDGNALPTDAPAPPPGEVTVVGWARTDATGSSTAVLDSEGGFTTRAISGKELGQAWGAPTYPAFMIAQTESPQATETLVPASLPDLGEGPHFFYGLQWWFFGVLALGGFGYLAYDEWRKSRSGETPQKPMSDRATRKAARRAAIEAGLAKARAEKARSEKG